MKKHAIYFGFIVLPITTSVLAVDFPSQSDRSGSNYGLIQNVQNYSTNPSYNSNGYYNQKTVPIIVNATGEELGSGECMSVVNAVISSYCYLNNNCDGMQLTDVKPAAIVQLSKMNGNYSNACGGYIDNAFYEYKNKSNNINSQVAFPTAITMGNNTLTLPAISEMPKTDVEKRTDELARLQKQNGSENFGLTSTSMPKTINDVSFEQQIANKTAGYEPWKEVWADVEVGTDGKTEHVCIKNCSYQTPHLETTTERFKREDTEATTESTALASQLKLLKQTDYEAWCIKVPVTCKEEKAAAAIKDMQLEKERLSSQKETDRLTMTHSEFCETYPSDSECNTNININNTDRTQRIIDALKGAIPD